ncbi:SMI1/KNR4 family protein [Niabella beijingensis]|uniref:SMI1/KNR4 family protein n=1 Tax=Niabella beijingensis TaxID=2872700 RepID=UPI001CBC6213|nr:SMI1/KNR4 family protein [Niabella beijingensis]MBZ4187807.1 SMI1/KNR4 family protein [Niabella beijingensis]
MIRKEENINKRSFREGNNIVMKLEPILKELSKFSTAIATSGGSLENTKIIECENRLGLMLPLDYKAFLREHNGFDIMGNSVFGIDDSASSLENVYKFEHSEVANPMPLYLIPFSPDGQGNHYCFDTRSNNTVSCDIVFWQHDYEYSEGDGPEIVNNSFLDWFQEVIIDWTLEEYDYNGNER